MHKSFVSRCIVFTFVTLAMNVCLSSAIADQPLASIVGTGFVDLNDDIGLDLTFRTTVAAFIDADGSVRGSMVSHTDLSVFGLGQLSTVGSVVDIVIDEDPSTGILSAWICNVVTQTNNPALAPVGSMQITMVFDLGGQRQDIMHTEGAQNLPVEDFDVNGDGVVDCQDRPMLFPSVVDQGDFKIRVR